MTLAEIQAMLAEADPDIKHYFTAKDGAYSYWEETKRLPTMADDRHTEEAWRFYVHRYTQDPWDPVVRHIMAALDARPEVAVSYDVDPSNKGSEYVHHIWECEGY